MVLFGKCLSHIHIYTAWRRAGHALFYCVSTCQFLLLKIIFTESKWQIICTEWEVSFFDQHLSLLKVAMLFLAGSEIKGFALTFIP